MDNIESALRGKVILITGGTGSFGRRVASYLLRFDPAQIRIFSRDEKKQWEMANQFSAFRYLLGDVRDRQHVMQCMEGVDFVFHAAALKQVPKLESFPLEAVQTNILGSQNVCEAAKHHRVKVVVALSTDKAVKPVNAMGISKAMMERIICSQNEFGGPTVFCCTRYGNVMGSRGSVIPFFLEQIANGRPLTVTVPSMTRFLMTLDESVDLVLHAMTNARGGEIFTRKAPACTVGKLAEVLASKFSPQGARHDISVVGRRPGEKLHEVLVNEHEMQRAEETRDYFTILPEYAGAVPRNKYAEGEEYTSANTRQVDTLKELGAMVDRMQLEEAER